MYKKCSEIPIFNFFELIKSRDPIHLFKSGEIPEDISTEELSNAVSELLTEYNELTKNTALMREYRDHLDIEYLEAKYNFSKMLIALYLDHGEIEIITAINRFDWGIKRDQPLLPQLEALTKKLIGVKNQLKIKKANFIKKYRRNKTEEQPTNFNLQKQIIYLETGIPLSYKINIHEDSIERFVYWNEVLESKNKAVENG